MDDDYKRFYLPIGGRKSSGESEHSDSSYDTVDLLEGSLESPRGFDKSFTPLEKTASVQDIVSASGVLSSIKSSETLIDVEDIPLDEPIQQHKNERKHYATKLLEDAKLIGDVKFYKPTFQVAEDLLTNALDEAKKILADVKVNVKNDLKPYPNVIWPTQAEFNIFVGLDKIDKYVSTWKLHSDWKYYIDLKQINEFPFTKEYVYEVKFSCPRNKFPVAQATASVYFFIGVSYCNPLNSLVDVMFMVESTGSKLYPGHVHFNQKWLEIVVDSKVHFYKQIRL